MNRVVLFALAAFAIFLFVAKPWDGGDGPKQKLVSHLDDAFGSAGVPNSIKDCLSDGIDRELTDAEAQTLLTAIESGTVPTDTAIMSNPLMRSAGEKIGRVGAGCASAIPGFDAAQAAARFGGG
jgi:hypothetical protein